MKFQIVLWMISILLHIAGVLDARTTGNVSISFFTFIGWARKAIAPHVNLLFKL